MIQSLSDLSEPLPRTATPAVRVRRHCAASCPIKLSSLVPAAPVSHGGPGADTSGEASEEFHGDRYGDSLKDTAASFTGSIPLKGVIPR
ncbi:hypothetical protein INR49_013243 [Caranx melampygus]|nr:hypothetical protein INR49_013243 [Caranx melampygus]